MGEKATTVIDTPPASGRLGRALWRWRRLNQVKQLSVAAEFGVDQATVCRWERGVHDPEPKAAAKLFSLLTARPSSASDHALKFLVENSHKPTHLVCDVSHKLLAVSRGRSAEWLQPAEDLLDRSLWRFATPDIMDFERRLTALGWDDAVAPELRMRTAGATYDELKILPGVRMLVKFVLSDGRAARLVSG